MSGLRLAHLSDPHLAFAPPPGTSGRWWSKRTLSRWSWSRGRHLIQRPEVLAAAVADIRAQAPDHIMVTGDITNFSLPSEFSAAADWLATLETRAEVSVIPGNHDALVPVLWAEGLGKWQRWMCGDAANTTEPFPYLRVREGVALIGLSSAVPTAPGFASGELGTKQLARLAALLDETGARGLCRVIALHHPPADCVVPRRKHLRDRVAFRAVLARCGAELVLHGHSRDARFDPLPGPQGLIASMGLPSISALPNPKDEGARWHLLDLVQANTGWEIGVTVRVLNTGCDGFVTAARYRLSLPTR